MYLSPFLDKFILNFIDKKKMTHMSPMHSKKLNKQSDKNLGMFLSLILIISYFSLKNIPNLFLYNFMLFILTNTAPKSRSQVNYSNQKTKTKANGISTLLLFSWIAAALIFSELFDARPICPFTSTFGFLTVGNSCTELVKASDACFSISCFKNQTWLLWVWPTVTTDLL